MSELSLERLLSVVGLCLVVLTGVISLLAIRLCGFIHRLEQLLPAGQAALTEAQAALAQARGLLAHGRRAACHVEAALRHGSRACTGVFNEVEAFRARVQRWLVGTTCFGAKEELRRNGRARAKRRGR